MGKILESVNKRDFDRRISEVFEMLEGNNSTELSV